MDLWITELISQDPRAHMFRVAPEEAGRGGDQEIGSGKGGGGQEIAKDHMGFSPDSWISVRLY
jgi:hypothetical protein